MSFSNTGLVIQIIAILLFLSGIFISARNDKPTIFSYWTYIAEIFKKENYFDKLTAEEIVKLRPNFKTGINFESAGRFNPDRYRFSIQNVNASSVNVSNLRIRIKFTNTIEDIFPNIILPSNGNFSAALFENVGITENGDPYSYLMDSSELFNDYGCSIDIQKAVINGKSVNTDTATFYCKEWPSGALIIALLTVDKTTNIQFLEAMREGTFQGSYEYVIEGKKFTGKIEGEIK